MMALELKPLLEGKSIAKESPKDSKPKSAEGDLRLVIQVGAFAEADKAQEARMKLERAGLKTYTHVAETKEGKRIRVRVGPFATRAEAEKVAAKVKGLQLPASILTL
jgi:DedD protein